MSDEVPPAPARPLPVLVAEQTGGLLPVPWRLVRVEDSGRRVVVSVPVADKSIRGVRITETPGDVTLTVYRTPPPSGARTLIVIHTTAVVELSAPLGARRLRGGEDDGR